MYIHMRARRGNKMAGARKYHRACYESECCEFAVVRLSKRTLIDSRSAPATKGTAWRPRRRREQCWIGKVRWP